MAVQHIMQRPYRRKEKQFITMHIFGEKPVVPEVSEYFMDNFKWILDGGFDLISYNHYKQFAEGKHLARKYSIDDLVASCVPKSPGDQKNKRRQQSYYDANSLMLEYVLKEVFTPNLFNKLRKLSPHDKILFQGRYRDILEKLMLDRNRLFEDYDRVFNRQTDPLEQPTVESVGMHNILRQSIYGPISFNSFSDYEPGAGMAVVRQLVELRIRRAFGFFGYTDNNGTEYPITVSTIFKVLKNHTINSTPNIKSIERIYSFPNIYMHSGRYPYSWYPIFFELILRPISLGNSVRSPEGFSWDVNNAIKVRKRDFDAIQYEMRSQLAGKGKLIDCKPECEVIA